MALGVKNHLPTMWVPSLGQEDALEEGMASHSGVLAWRIPEEPGRLQSMGSQRQTWLKRPSTHGAGRGGDAEDKQRQGGSKIRLCEQSVIDKSRREIKQIQEDCITGA